MKAGLVTHYMPPHHGGIERVAETLFSGYGRAGINVRWVASRAPATAPAREDRRIRVACCNAPERLMGVPVPLWGRQGYRELSALVEWADVLHVHDCLYPSSAVTVMLARRARKPVALSQHVGFVRYRRRWLNWAESVAYASMGRAVLRRVSWIVLATPAAADHVSTLVRSFSSHVSAIPNGIDTAHFRPASADDRRQARQRLGLPSQGPVVLFVGRLVEKKGVGLVAAVSRDLANVHFLVVGDGPLRHLFSQRSANVTWVPTIVPERMPECYFAADCLLLPSHGEGLPLVVQEAMACGLPAVVSADEPFAIGLGGLDVCALAPRTVEGMAGRVTDVLADSGRRLGIRARAHVESDWSADAMTERYITLLHRLIASGVGPE
jgi:glycosyltransferase involved in cell wall biosynthesis